MSASVNSQVLLKKTLWNNENAFIGNEAAMDSISETYMKLEATLSDNASYKLKFQLAQKKIEKLISAIIESPYSGIGKPEALKHALAGKWSRRINKEHRIIYEVEGNMIKSIPLEASP